MLNPLVLIHLMGGVHNEMLMVGLMAAGIALTFQGRHVLGVTLVTVADRGQSHRRDRRCRSWCGCGCGICATNGDIGRVRAFLAATAMCLVIFVVVFGVLSAVAGVGLGWLTALAGSVKIINWLTVPTAAANVIHALGSGFFPVNFYATLRVTRYIGIADHRGVTAAVVVAVPARRPGRADRDRRGRW